MKSAAKENGSTNRRYEETNAIQPMKELGLESDVISIKFAVIRKVNSGNK